MMMMMSMMYMHRGAPVSYAQQTVILNGVENDSRATGCTKQIR